MPPSDRRFALRAHTAASHEALEATVGDMSTLAAYGHYLRGLRAGRVPLEAGLAQIVWPNAFGTWRPVMIGPELDRDMATLGYPLCHSPISITVPDDISGLLGTLYVTEGSALGARLVFARAKSLGLGADNGALHLAVQAGSTDSWRAFLEVLDNAADVDMDRAGRIAETTFAMMREAMKGQGGIGE